VARRRPDGPDAVDTLDRIAGDPHLGDRLAFRATLESRPARHDDPARPLHPGVADRLAARGIDRLYTHQAAAVDALRDARSVVLATGTASGKSLCYQIPIVESALAGDTATALLVFPTKALAQDQLRSLHEWLVPTLLPTTYDGDTGPDDRARIRRHAKVVLTNPEMLHVGILPSHERWATFFMRLRYVVVDELHTLRGIFGSHVAHVLRRLRRVCAHYGSSPVFCFASATIGNPAELATALCGLPVEAIDDDGSPHSERAFACWQRPLLDEHTGARASANVETADLVARFVADEHQTLAFTRSRKGSEIVAAQAKRMLTDRLVVHSSNGQVPRVAAYRAGYLPAERRELEHALTTGELAGVVATSALELGIDVGGLDAVVVNGFPGTLASLRQQSGRAGRTERRAAAVLVVGDDQLDQWYARHPHELLARHVEAAVVNPANPSVLRPQVACAAHEIPLTPADADYFGDGLDDAVRDLVRDDLLKPRHGRMYWAAREPPARRVGLRSGSSVEYELVDDAGDVVGVVDAARVFNVAHPGALYLHQGRQYRVEDLDPAYHRARLAAADDADEHTQTRESTDIRIVRTDRSVPVGAGTAHLGTVEVTNQVVAYQRKRTSTNELIEVVDLDLPPQSLTTSAVWFTLPLETLTADGVAPARILGTVHAAEHALIGLLPLFTICDRWDVGGVSMATNLQTGEPTIFVYDGYPGGAGIADLAFGRTTEHVRAARELVAACACDDGCPSCVQSPKCGNWNEYLDKSGAVRLLTLLSR
jgi:DEAD/DEAH box helicase domain-containing protein